MENLTPRNENKPRTEDGAPRRRRHRKHSRKKSKLSTTILKWMKKNPMRVIAILCGLVLVYITIMFFLYSAKDQKTPKQSEVRSSVTSKNYL